MSRLLRTPDRALDAACNFSAERPWMLALIIVACVLFAAAVEGGAL